MKKQTVALKNAAFFIEMIPPAKAGHDAIGYTKDVISAIKNNFSLSEQEITDLVVCHFGPRCRPAWDFESLVDLTKSVLLEEGFTRVR